VRVPASQDGDQHQDDRQRDTVVEPTLDVEQVPQPLRYVLVPDQRRGQHGIGGAEGGAHEQGLEPGQPDDPVGACGDGEQRERQTEQERTARQVPSRDDVAEPRLHAVGEEEQRDLDEHADDRVVGAQDHESEDAVTDEEARGETGRRWRARSAAPGWRPARRRRG
jgi:hypothetical protein